MTPLIDPATSSFLGWVAAYYDYARRAQSEPRALRELRRLHRHKLTVSEAYIVLHRDELCDRPSSRSGEFNSQQRCALVPRRGM